MTTTGAAPWRETREAAPQRRGLRVLTASARRLDLSKRRDVKSVQSASNSQQEAWSHYDQIPEAHFTIRHFGAAMSKVRWVVGWDSPADNRDPAPLFNDDGEMIEAEGLTPQIAASAVLEMARLDAGARGGLPKLAERLSMNLEVPGEAYLIGFPESEDAPMGEFVVASNDELAERQDRLYLRRSASQPNSDQTEIPAEAIVIRIWIDHPRFEQMADSPMMALAGEFRAALGLANERIAETNSQAGAGLLLIPNELDIGTEAAGDEEGDDEDPFMSELESALLEPIGDPESPKSVVPIVMRGPADHLAEVRHIELGRDRSTSINESIEAVVQRVARGMNAPVEVVEGHMNTTFSNAEQIDQDKWDDHYEPRVRMIAEALSSEYLRANLLQSFPDAGLVISNLVVIGDGAALIREPDVENNAGEAHANLTISDAAYRRAKGFTESDAPDEEEMLRRTSARKALLTGDVSLGLLQTMFADEAGIDLTPETPAEISPAPADESGEPIAASATPVSPVGRQLVELDRELRTSLAIAADARLDAALVTIGRHLRTKHAVRDRVDRSVPNAEVAATLGVEGMHEVGENPSSLALGKFDSLREHFGVLVEAANYAASTRLGIDAPDVLVDEGWAVLVDELERLLADRMLSPAAPDAVVADGGEVDPTLSVPHGLIRQVLAIVGGDAADEIDDSTGAWVSIDVVGRPAGGVATGRRMLDAAADAGRRVEGWRWIYGPGLRQSPFDPHFRLDGYEFVEFNDERLRNDESFPSTRYYIPGDHSGCKCDIEPIIIDAS